MSPIVSYLVNCILFLEKYENLCFSKIQMDLLLNPQTSHIYQNYAEIKLEVIYFNTIIFIANVIIFKLSTMIMFYYLT